MEQAACIVRRSKATTGTLEPTESYKRGQIEELKSFTDFLNLWIDLSDLEITYMDKGEENEVFHDGNSSVIKLNNFEYAGDDLERIWITTDEEQTLSRLLEAFPTLKDATEPQRLSFKIGRFGNTIRWEEIDEDIHISTLMKH